jgi:hypothetical protein
MFKCEDVRCEDVKSQLLFLEEPYTQALSGKNVCHLAREMRELDKLDAQVHISCRPQPAALPVTEIYIYIRKTRPKKTNALFKL